MVQKVMILNILQDNCIVKILMGILIRTKVKLTNVKFNKDTNF